MSKLNLINLSKDEITKEEAQKMKAGAGCPCPCICGCFCDFEPSSMQYQPDTDYIKVEDKIPVLIANN